jgi:hypothetical protein
VCGLAYYTLPGSQPMGKAPQAPVVFLHGVGAGVLPYLLLLFNYASTGARLVFFPQGGAPEGQGWPAGGLLARSRAPKARLGTVPAQDGAACPRRLSTALAVSCAWTARRPHPTPQPPCPAASPPPGRPIVAPEYRHVSMRLTDDIPTIEDLSHSLASFLQALGFDQVHLLPAAVAGLGGGGPSTRGGGAPKCASRLRLHSLPGLPGLSHPLTPTPPLGHHSPDPPLLPPRRMWWATLMAALSPPALYSSTPRQC